MSKRVMWWPVEDAPAFMPPGFELVEVDKAIFRYDGNLYEYECVS